MKVAFLGSYGFGNLGDELCLFESFKKYSSEQNYVFSNDPLWTYRSLTWDKSVQFFRTRPELKAIQPDRIVLGGGGVGFLPSIKDALHWMADHLDRDCELIINNIGVANIDASWIDERIRPVFSRLKKYSVRDDQSFNIAKNWGVDVLPQITYYPEIEVCPEPVDYSFLRRGGIGIAITGQAKMKESILRNKTLFSNLLFKTYGNLDIVPIVSTWQRQNVEENDFEAFHWLVKEFQIEERVKSNYINFDDWRNNCTVSRLRAEIKNCEVLVTQRKHNMIHALGSNTKFVAVAPTDDDSLDRVWASAAAKAQVGCSVIRLK